MPYTINQPLIGNVPANLAFDASGGLTMPQRLSAKGPWPSFDVRAYGAKGDGATNDSPAINSAIAAVTAQGSGCLFFPSGTYLLNAALSPLPSNCSVRGADRYSTTLQVGASYGSGDVISCPTNGAGITVADIGIASATTRTAGAGINTNGADDVIIQDFTLSGMFTGISINNNTVRILVVNGRIVNSGVNTGCAILINNAGGGDTYLRGISIANPLGGNQPLAGVRIQSTSQVTLINCDVNNCLTGLQIDPAANQTVANLFMEFCQFDSHATNGALVYAAAATASVLSVKAVNCWFSNTANAAGFLTQSGGQGIIDDIELVACRFLNNATHGIQHGAGANFGVIGGTIAGNSAASSNASDGVNVAADVVSFRIQGCKIGTAGAAQTAQQRYGVYVTTGAANNYQIVNNDLVGNATGPLFDGGQGVACVTAPNIGGQRSGSVSTVTATVSTANVEIVVVSVTLPANSLSVGSTFRLRFMGTGTTGAAGTQTLRIRCGAPALTASILTSIAPAAATTGTGKGVMFEGTLTIRSLGTTGSCLANCLVFGDATSPLLPLTIGTTTSGVAVNTTIDNQLAITAQSSASNITLSIKNAFIEAVRP